MRSTGSWKRSGGTRAWGRSGGGGDAGGRDAIRHCSHGIGTVSVVRLSAAGGAPGGTWREIPAEIDPAPRLQQGFPQVSDFRDALPHVVDPEVLDLAVLVDLFPGHRRR